MAGEAGVKEATAAGFDPERLRQLRRAAGLTQRELAERAGTDHTTIAKYESRDRIPYVERLAGLARALGVTPAQLTQTGAGTLTELRVVAGLTQASVAERAGLVRSRYAGLERGEIASLDPAVAARLADAFGVSVEEIANAHAQSRAAHQDRGTDTLVQLRTAAGLTQMAAATQAGLVRTRYSALERGEVATLDPGIAARLAQTYGVSIGQVRTAHALCRAVYLARRD
jgi:transcriptional regulator with XRE-family HTH domain